MGRLEQVSLMSAKSCENCGKPITMTQSGAQLCAELDEIFQPKPSPAKPKVVTSDGRAIRDAVVPLLPKTLMLGMAIALLKFAVRVGS